MLAADNGGDEGKGTLRQMGFEADYIDTQSFDKAEAIRALKARFGIGEELITSYSHPYVYLNRELIQAKGLDQAEVERAVAQELTQFDGIALAVASSALREGNLPDTRIIKSVLRNYHPSRSGDIYVVYEPNRFINDMDGLTVAATHGSPWRYDTYVPVIFAGVGIAAQRVSRPIETVDIAPTLSILFGTKPPTGSVGVPLLEVIGQ